MAHNKDGYAVDDGQVDRTFTPRKSRAERRDEATWADELADELVALPPSELEHVPLSDHVRQAVVDARGITRHGAKRRQMMYVAKLLRALEPEPIREALDGVADGAPFEELERWRDRILAQGDGAISVFLEKHPAGDRQRLRQLARAAAQTGNKATKAKKQLFQSLREAAGL